MSLIGKRVKIKVTQPYSKHAYSLLGTIVSDKNPHRLLVRLPKPLTGRSMASDMVVLKPYYLNETFEKLGADSALDVSGFLSGVYSHLDKVIVAGRVSIDESPRMHVLYQAPKPEMQSR